MADVAWTVALDRLKAALGKNNYTAWIKPLQFLNKDGEAAHFAVPTAFFGTYVRQHFEDQIVYHLRKAGMQVSRISFSVQQGGQTSAPQGAAQKQRQGGQCP